MTSPAETEFVDCMTKDGHGLARTVEADKEVIRWRKDEYFSLEENYTLGSWQWFRKEACQRALLFPIDSRTTADMSGNTYVFYANGGWSWGDPYVAGVYALCAQVKPDITLEEFYRVAMGASIEITRSENTGSAPLTFHRIHPEALFDALTR